MVRNQTQSTPAALRSRGAVEARLLVLDLGGFAGLLFLLPGGVGLRSLGAHSLGVLRGQSLLELSLHLGERAVVGKVRPFELVLGVVVELLTAVFITDVAP